MKKFSTQIFALAVALAATLGAVAMAQPTPPLEIARDAPERYIVVKGDTLWDISGRFLQKPWRWPEIWQLNRDAIKDPHWIYPGDVVWLDRSGDTPRLRAQNFPRATTFNASLSSMASAKSFLSLAFSASSALKRLASGTSIPPNLRRHR